MLVLTRKPREEIRIGDGIKITVLRVKGQSVRIGIEAPNDVRIIRTELEIVDEEASDTGSADPNQEPAPRVAPRQSNLLDGTCLESTGQDNRRLLSCKQRLPHARKPVNSTLRMLAARRRENTLTRSIADASTGESSPTAAQTPR